MTEIGRDYLGRTGGVLSRSAIHRIYHKWKNWQPVIPFNAGDTVRFEGCDYRVIVPGVFGGTVKNLQTGQEIIIPWRESRDVFAVKL